MIPCWIMVQASSLSLTERTAWANRWFWLQYLGALSHLHLTIVPFATLLSSSILDNVSVSVSRKVTGTKQATTLKSLSTNLADPPKLLSKTFRTAASITHTAASSVSSSSTTPPFSNTLAAIALGSASVSIPKPSVSILAAVNAMFAFWTISAGVSPPAAFLMPSTPSINTLLLFSASLTVWS